MIKDRREIKLIFGVAAGLHLALVAGASTGCATMLKDPQQRVVITGAQEGMSFATRYRSYKLTEGMNALYLDRSVDDIEITLACPSGTRTHKVYIKTHPSRLFIVGNFLFLVTMVPVGHAIDYLTEQGWNIESPVELGPYCTDESL